MKNSCGKTALPMGGTHIAAHWAGLPLVKIRTTFEKFTENGLPWEGPPSVTEESPFPKQTKEKIFRSDKLTINSMFCLLALSMIGKEELRG